MEQETDVFKEYVYKGLDAMLRLSARAGDTLRVASNNAIEKIDAFQLERKRVSLYALLGKTVHSILVSGEPVVGVDFRIAGIIEEISQIGAELERRFGVSGSR